MFLQKSFLILSNHLIHLLAFFENLMLQIRNLF